MKLAMRPNAFIFVRTLVHISEICSSKRNSESIKTPISVFFMLDLIKEPVKSDSVGVFEQSKKLIKCRLQFRDYCISIRNVSVRCDVINIIFKCQDPKTYLSNLFFIPASNSNNKISFFDGVHGGLVAQIPQRSTPQWVRSWE